MKRNDYATYTKVLTDVIDSTTKNGEDLNDDYELIKKSMDSDSVAQLDTDELSRIKKHFQDGTDRYQENVNKLQNLKVPVKLMGKNTQLINAYKEYAQACQDMTDSIDASNQKVDVAKFQQSEKDQEDAIGKVSNTTGRIMNSL